MKTFSSDYKVQTKWNNNNDNFRFYLLEFLSVSNDLGRIIIYLEMLFLYIDLAF